MSNKKITVEITKEQKEFLALIQHQDAANNQSQAVQWCIDACMKIEKLYGIDACYISFNDIRLKERWESTDAFVATCNAFNALDEAKKELGHKHRLDASIEDINTLQDTLIQLGYSIQKIKK